MLNLLCYKKDAHECNLENWLENWKDGEYETERHIEFLEKGENPPQETRGWNEDKGITFAQRSKEEAQDYRYFPDPDIPPMVWERSFMEGLKKQLPELPEAKKDRFIKSFGLSLYDAEQLLDSWQRAFYFEECIKLAKQSVTPKVIANWIINKQVDTRTVKPEDLIAEIQKSIAVEEVSDEVITEIVKEVLAANPKAVSDFKAGREQAKMFLFGNILKALQGKGDKKKVMEILANKLSS